MCRGALLVLLLLAERPRRALPSPTACRGTSLIAQDVWTLARELDRGVQIAHIPREYTTALADAFLALLGSNAVNEAVGDCALGTAALAIHSLPQIERRFGAEAALQNFLLYQRLVQEFGHLRQASGFSWSLETHQSAAYPLLLGLQQSTCFGINLKFFVYETEFARFPLGCSQGMFATEVFVHRYLLHSECRTSNPDEADFFFVPVYAACVMTKEGKLAGEMDAFYKALLKDSLHYFSRHDGRDHIFLWSSETIDFPSWRDHIRDSVFLSVEMQPIECSDFDFFSEETAENFGEWCHHCHWCLSPWKDLVIPGFVENWSIRKMRAAEKAFEEKEYTACYHGADSDNLAIYQYANTTARTDLQRLTHMRNTSIGRRFGIITDYFKRLGSCHFCFVPKGLGYWSARLYEVIHAGCIPVILSDGIGLPFDDFLDWPSFSIKWPMGEVTPDLVHHLEGLLARRRPLVQQLHAALQRSRCWFDYTSQDPGCSPYLALLRSLERRRALRPRWLGRAWGLGSGSISRQK